MELILTLVGIHLFSIILSILRAVVDCGNVHQCLRETIPDDLNFAWSAMTQMAGQWPGTLVIRGSPRHAQGGVDRRSQDLELKLGNSMNHQEPKSSLVQTNHNFAGSPETSIRE